MDKTMRRTLMSCASAVALGFLIWTPAAADTSTIPPAATAPGAAAPRSDLESKFKRAWSEYRADIDKLLGRVNELSEKLKSQSAAGPEVKKAEVEAVRESLRILGGQVQQDAPLAMRLNQFEQWLLAQVTRIQNRRESYGNPEFVEQLISRYKAQLKEVGLTRETMGNGSKDIDSLLTEISKSEDRIAEWMMIEDAENLTKELRTLVDTISKTINGMRDRLREQPLGPSA
jgi:hypothetical protein